MLQGVREVTEHPKQKHRHAPDNATGYQGCHSINPACQCVRCLLETGQPIPAYYRLAGEAYLKGDEVATYKCEKCAGLKVALVPETRGAPPTQVCMSCGAMQIVTNETAVERKTTLMDKVGITKKPVSLAARMGRPSTEVVEVQSLSQRSKASSPGGKAGQPVTTDTGKMLWTTAERQELREDIERKGVTSGSVAFCKRHPTRTVQGCIYQWNNRSKW